MSIRLLMIIGRLTFHNQPHSMVSNHHFLSGQKKSLTCQSRTIKSSLLSCQQQQPHKTSSRKTLFKGILVRDLETIDKVTANQVKKEQDRKKTLTENRHQEVQDLTKEIKESQEELEDLKAKLEQEEINSAQGGFLSQALPCFI